MRRLGRRPGAREAGTSEERVSGPRRAAGSGSETGGSTRTVESGSDSLRTRRTTRRRIIETDGGHEGLVCGSEAARILVCFHLLFKSKTKKLFAWFPAFGQGFFCPMGGATKRRACMSQARLSSIPNRSPVGSGIVFCLYCDPGCGNSSVASIPFRTRPGVQGFRFLVIRPRCSRSCSLNSSRRCFRFARQPCQRV